MNMRNTLMFVLLISPFLVSCERETIQSGFEFDLSPQQYAEIKRIPGRAETRKEAAFSSFSERTRVANYLLDGPLKEDLGVRVLAIEAKNKFAIDTYLENFVNAELTADAIKDFYEQNAGDFVHSIYEVSHLLIRLPGTDNEDSVEAAFDKAQEILTNAENGEEFAALVAAHSDDKSTLDNGGKLPAIDTRNGDPAIIGALSSLDEGELSQPVRTRLGVQLFRLDSKEDQQIDFELVKDKIAYQLKQDIREKELARLRDLANKS